MRFPLNGRSSKLDFVDVQLMTGNQDGGHKPEAGMKNLGLSFYTRYQRESPNQTGIVVIEEHNRTNVNTAMSA